MNLSEKPSSTATARVTLVRPLTNSEVNSPFFLPLGILCIGSALDAAGHTVKVIDYEFLYRSGKFELQSSSYIRDFCEPILEGDPSVVGLSVLADTLPLALLMTAYIKARCSRIVTVLGGPGVFGVPYKLLLQQFPHAADYICKREGELSFLELVNALAAGEENPEVPGMIGLRDGIIDFGDMQLADLDILPRPGYELVPLDQYLAMASPRIFDIYVGAGCTFGCKFCTTAPFWGRRFRAKSPSRVLMEMDELHRLLGISRFNLLHDNFSNDKAYLSEFVAFFASNNGKYEWGCACRPDSLSQELLRGMKAAGCFTIFSGTDSGSSKILRSMAKASSTKRFYESFQNCRDLGIKLETNTIIGYPDENDLDFEDSLSIVFDCVAFGSTSSDVSVLQPLPGAPVTESHKEYLVGVDKPLAGNFLPDSVLRIVREAPQLFPGFAFIKKGNHDHDYYCSAVKLVRYFTRHYFRTLFFLKQACAIDYIDVFHWMAEEKDPTKYAERFDQFVSNVKITDGPLEALMDIVKYDHTVEALKNTNLGMEITNIYAEPERFHLDQRHLLVETDFEVVEMFGTLPKLDWQRLSPRSAVYLVYANLANQIVTLRLSPWQRDLWESLRHNATDAALRDVNDRFVELLGSQLPKPQTAKGAESAVAEAIRIFVRILQEAKEPLRFIGPQTTLPMQPSTAC